MSLERTFFDRIIDSPFIDKDEDLGKIDPKDFIPMPGTILVVLPPEIKKIGNIHLPAGSAEAPCYARVASVPVGECDCCFRPGDWVVFRKGTPTPIGLHGRNDLALLQYTNEADSDIYGIVKEPTVGTSS